MLLSWIQIVNNDEIMQETIHCIDYLCFAISLQGIDHILKLIQKLFLFLFWFTSRFVFQASIYSYGKKSPTFKDTNNGSTVPNAITTTVGWTPFKITNCQRCDKHVHRWEFTRKGRRRNKATNSTVKEVNSPGLQKSSGK